MNSKITTVFYFKQLKIVAFLFLSITSSAIFSQVVIKSQSFDLGASGYADDLGYTSPNATYGYVDTTTFESSPNSFHFTGLSNRNTNLTFDDVDISLYNSVTVTVSFAADNVDNNEDLILRISYDNGSNYANTKLIDGDDGSGGQDVSWGAADGDGDSVATNSYTFNVPDTETNVKIRIRARSLETGEYFYVDNVLIEGVLIVPTYCDSYGDNADGFNTGTRRVVFNTINNATPDEDNDYSDFTAISTIVTQSSTYDLSVYVNTDSWTSFFYSLTNTYVWIDWNQDLDFDDPGEEYYLGTADDSTSEITSLSPLSITVPVGATLGATRMRVSTKHYFLDALPQSCDTGFAGEVEDYTIIVIDDVPKIDFDGVDDYLDFGDEHDLTGNFALEAWVLQQNTNANGTIMSKGDIKSGSERGFTLTIQNDYPNLTWYNSGGVLKINITASYPITNNKWHHIAASYNGSTATLYVNGIDVGSGSSSGAPGNRIESFLIGASYDSDTPIIPKNYFNGFIDEVRIWDVALSSTQMREMMNQEIEKNGTFVRGKVIPRDISGGLEWDDLEGYYDMNNDDSDDASGNGKNGYSINIITSQEQTAPIPYYTKTDGDWEDNTVLTPWQYGDSVWDEPNGYGIDGTTRIDWNIVRTAHNIDVDRNVKVLGLISESMALITDEEITDSELTIGAGGGDFELNITHYLKLDGKIDLQNESQLIQGDNSWLDEDSSGYLERDQQGTANSFTYNYWSSPVSKRSISANNVAYKTGDILRDGHRTQDDIPYLNFDPDSSASVDPEYADGSATNPRKIATYWIWKFTSSQTNDYANWEWVGNFQDVNVTEGYTMKGVSGASAISDLQNYVFRGKPNNVLNNQTEIVHSNFTASLDTNGNPKISLTGNPFPSALDATKFINDNSSVIQGQLYFWEHWGGGTHKWAQYQGGYATRNLMTGVEAASHPDVDQTDDRVVKEEPTQYVPVAQGFYVIQKHDYDSGLGTYSNLGSGNIIFKNSQRIFKTEGANESIFTKGTTSKDKTTSIETKEGKEIIRIKFTSPTGFRRQVAIGFDENATDALDYGYDAFAGDFLPNDAFLTQDNRYLVINSFGAFDATREIPISVFIDEESQGGIQKFAVDAIENFDQNINVYIKDNYNNGETFEITNNTFEIKLEPGEHKDRFALVFQSRLLTYSELPSLEEGFHVFMNNKLSEININRITDVEIIKATLMNYLGQTINIWTNDLENRNIKLPVNTATGGYILSLETVKGKVSKKLLIY